MSPRGRADGPGDVPGSHGRLIDRLDCDGPEDRHHGLGFAPLDANPRQLLESDAGRAWLEAAANPIAPTRRLVAPAAPTRAFRAFPDIGAPLWPLGGLYNRLTHLVGGQLGWQPFRLADHQTRLHAA